MATNIGGALVKGIAGKSAARAGMVNPAATIATSEIFFIFVPEPLALTGQPWIVSVNSLLRAGAAALLFVAEGGRVSQGAGLLLACRRWRSASTQRAVLTDF